jgi:putative spermidine/putrescine transport system permease protein
MSIGLFLLKMIVGIALCLVIGPIVVVLVVSFSAGTSISFPPPGFSLRWFAAFFSMEEMRNAFILSVVLAFAAACGSTLLGLLGAIYVTRTRNAFSGLMQALMIAPLVFPAIILGLALLLIYRTIHMPVTLGLFVAHIVVCLPYAFRAVLTSLQSFDTTLEEAGQSLGASPLKAFLRVTLPIIWPGVLAGWLFAFVVSFGELNAALFLTGPGVVTLPIEIFNYLQFQGNQLVVAAASALQVLVIAIVLIVAQQVIGAKQIVQR